MNHQRIPIADLVAVPAGRPFQVLLGLGFDQRCLTALGPLMAAGPQRVVALTNVGWEASGGANQEQFRKITGDRGQILGEGRSSILEVSDELLQSVQQSDPSILTVVDITSLSHELLSVLVAILERSGRLDNTVLCYTEAEQYSVNTDSDKIWLSRGVSSIRSVLGYAGELLPSRRLHLVLAVGFEVERALNVIAAYEPAVLSVGIGRQDQSISALHQAINARFARDLEASLKEQSWVFDQIHQFRFSCVDPFQARLDLKGHLDSFPGDLNTVVCPLNTKISTVGFTLLCLDTPRVQMCYAQPVDYNTLGYVKPGQFATVIEMACLRSPQQSSTPSARSAIDSAAAPG